MNLIDVYIQEVIRRLPEKNRDDIALELRSTIEDMLPDDSSEEDVKEVLEKLGNPASLASGYRDRPMHLIGPRYFDIYTTLLKMILPIAAVISVISMIAEYFIGFGGEEAVINVLLSLLGEGIWRLIEVGVQVFFWVTIVFAIIERTDKGKDEEPLTASLQKWTPEDLKNISHIPKTKAIKKCEVFGGLMWTAIWGTIYFYADHLVGIYEGGGNRLEFIIPAINQEVLLQFWPIVLIVFCLEIFLSIFKLIKRQWTKGMAIYNAAFQVLATIAFIVILIHPHLFTQDFMVYMTDLLEVNAKQLKTWIISGGIFFFVLSAAISLYDGIRKAGIR